jgi:DNA-binding XRE family transcriptional regulator
VPGRRVAWCAGVDDQDLAACPGQDQGCGQAGGASADYDDVVVVHVGHCGAAVPGLTTIVAVSGKNGSNGGVDNTTTTITAALEQVGPCLKQLRAQRGVTLTTQSEATGISKSTLSRLENGQRRTRLELLLPLAQA